MILLVITRMTCLQRSNVGAAGSNLYLYFVQFTDQRFNMYTVCTMIMVASSVNLTAYTVQMVTFSDLSTHVWFFDLYVQIQKGIPRFFPVLKARCLEHDEDETNRRLRAIEGSVNQILERSESEVSSIPSEGAFPI